MTLGELLTDLLDQANAGPPTAAALRARYEPKAAKVTVAGPELRRPKWGRGVHGGDDVFLDLEGDLVGLQLHEDSRGWGAYAEIEVRRGELSDVEAVVGKTKGMPRAPEAFSAGTKVSAYMERGGKTVRVFTELIKSGPAVARVPVHFQK